MSADPADFGVDERSPAPAVTRAAAILGLLAADQPLGLTDIARTLTLAKSSTLNLLVALEQAGLVRRDQSGYRLGRTTVELGAAYVRDFDIVREFHRLCESDEMLEVQLLHLAVLHDTEVLYLARHEGRHPWRLSANVGDRFPASITAVGSALLADLDDADVRARFADPETLPIWTDHSTPSVEALLKKLAATRERGWAIDDRETNPGIYGMAVLVPPRRPGDAPVALGTSMRWHGPHEPDDRDQVLVRLLRVRDHLASPAVLSAP